MLLKCSVFRYGRREEIRNMHVTAGRLASLLESAPVGAVARLTLISSHARQEAALVVAEHLCRGLDSVDRDQLALPL